MTLLFGIVSVGFAMLFALWGARVLGVLGDLLGVLRGVQGVMAEGMQGPGDDVERRFRDLEDLVDRLPQRGEEIKRESTRLDGRARYAVSRAREELAERGLSDERLEDLGRELQLIDGGGSESGGLPAVPEDMGADAGPPQLGTPEPSWHDVARSVKFGA